MCIYEIIKVCCQKTRNTSLLFPALSRTCSSTPQSVQHIHRVWQHSVVKKKEKIFLLAYFSWISLWIIFLPYNPSLQSKVTNRWLGILPLDFLTEIRIHGSMNYANQGPEAVKQIYTITLSPSYLTVGYYDLFWKLCVSLISERTSQKRPIEYFPQIPRYHQHAIRLAFVFCFGQKWFLSLETPVESLLRLHHLKTAFCSVSVWHPNLLGNLKGLTEVNTEKKN